MGQPAATGTGLSVAPADFPKHSGGDEEEGPLRLYLHDHCQQEVLLGWLLGELQLKAPVMEPVSAYVRKTLTGMPSLSLAVGGLYQLEQSCWPQPLVIEGQGERLLAHTVPVVMIVRVRTPVLLIPVGPGTARSCFTVCGRAE